MTGATRERSEPIGPRESPVGSEQAKRAPAAAAAPLPGGVRPNVRATIPMLVRARELHLAGLSWAAVAVVVRLDFGRSPHPATLRHYVKGHTGDVFPAGANPGGTVGLSSGGRREF